MGGIISKLRGKKETSKERLEAIERELRDISRFQIDTELKQKRIIGHLWIYSCVAYVISIIVFYFFLPRGKPWKELIWYLIPFVIFPFFMYFVKIATAWYFQNKIVNNREKYVDLKKEKQRILDDVMDNETFKVAKEILEKYAPRELLPKYLAEQQRNVSLSPMTMSGASTLQQTPNRYSFQDGIRRRQQGLAGTSTPARSSYPQSPITRPFTSGPGQYLRQPTNAFPYSRPPLSIMGAPSSAGTAGRGPGPSQMPTYMVPLPPTNPTLHNRSSGWFDKLVDYVVGDGVANRYALICRYCATHNGLATAEDFPYTGFRCVFCHQFNPPKQVRPTAPKLPINQVLIEEMEQSTSTAKSDSSVASESADENESDSQVQAKSKKTEGIDSDTNEGPIVTLEDSPNRTGEEREDDDNPRNSTEHATNVASQSEYIESTDLHDEINLPQPESEPADTQNGIESTIEPSKERDIISEQSENSNIQIQEERLEDSESNQALPCRIEEGNKS